MKTLFPEKFNWSAFILFLIFIRLLFFSVSWVSFFALVISIYQFTLLFDSISSVIPTRHLLGSFMCVQFFLGPFFAYNGLDEYQYFMYKMRIPEADYFSFIIPAVCFFIIGLHINSKKLYGEIVNQDQIKIFVKNNPLIPYIFIGIGLTTSVFAVFFSAELAFLFYLLGGLKFIGLFLLVLGKDDLKVLPLVIVISSIITSSLASGMFHDLLTWIIYSVSIFGLKYKFNVRIKLIGLTFFMFIVVTIQILKQNYRKETGANKESAGFQTFAKLYQKENEGNGVFSFENLAKSNVRINQGFIITNIMFNVPNKEPFANGSEMYDIVESAIMPRILAPNKLNAGDRTLFTKYSGIPLTEGTSMGLSSIGDAYINFDIFGAVIFMFILGLFYSWVLNYFHKKSKKFPILILFTALVFYYPIRPDCELQTILGHLVKSCFLLLGIFTVWKSKFSVRKQLS